MSPALRSLSRGHPTRGHPNRGHPSRSRRPEVWVLLLPAWILLLLASILLLPTQGWATARKAGPTFSRFVRSWQARSAVDVTKAMDPDGAARFTLIGYPLSGKTRIMKPAQARASLKAYFRQLSGARLRDVTPTKSPRSVRLYEFTYKPTRENGRTTRLQVQLKRDRNGSWVLASVTESVKPRD